MIIPVKTSQRDYDIVLRRGALLEIGKLLDLDRKVLVVTDSGVPSQYAQAVAAAAREPFVVTVKEGEASKCLDTLKLLLDTMVKKGFTRTDCVVAVGGGVVGDLSGLTASLFMRGVDFYNVPTTVLSQLDSSIGGKTAIDFDGIKNIVGTFYPPKKVVIDPDTIKTLPDRQISNGLAEAVKMAATSDSALFEIFEKGYKSVAIDTIIEKGLLIKKSVVEEDEKETGLRKVLNFGHTVAHAIESADNFSSLYHGECVAIGMLVMCSANVRARLKKVLCDLNLPSEPLGTVEEIVSACRHDKKASGDSITIVYVEEIGSFEFRKISFAELEKLVKEVM